MQSVERPNSRRSATVALVLALGCFARPTWGDDVSVKVQAAGALSAKGDWAGALAILRPLADDPKLGVDPRVQSALGNALLASGDPAEAVAVFRAVVRVRPDAADRLDLASALLATAKDRISGGARLSIHVVPYVEDSLAQAKAAGQGDPELRRRAACIVGEGLLLLGNPKAAREALNDPTLVKDATVEDLLARACYGLSDFVGAADAWGRAGNALAQAAAWSAGKDPRAITAYASMALEHLEDPTVGDLAIRGAAYVDGGDGLDAALVAATVPDGMRWAVERLRGRIAERRGRWVDAVARYRATLVARSQDWESERDLARALHALSAEDPSSADEAIERYRSVLSSHPDDTDTRAGLGWQARGDATGAHREWPDHRRLDRAVAIFRELAQTAPDDGLAWSQFGNAARIGGDSGASLQAFDRAVEINAFDASTWNDRGIALLAAGRRDEALGSFEHAILIDSSDTAPRQNAARLLRLAGRDDEADAHLDAALRTARAVAGPSSLYRSLLDRGARARRRPELR